MTEPLRVMVTAAGSGIGRAIARAFADAGATVHICDVDEALLQLATSDYPEIAAECLDVTDEVAIERWFDDALDELDGLDVLVNNAGIAGPTAAVEDMDYDGWQRCMAVCLDSQFLACRRAVPVMKDQGSGSIINISSTAGLTAHDDAAYTASKWGLRGLTKTAVLQFSPWNIRVNSIHPGQIADTGFFQSGGEAFAHAARAAIPLHRQGTPLECAELVLFLASDESSFISGAEIAIDGGYIAAGLAGLRNRVRDEFKK